MWQLLKKQLQNHPTATIGSVRNGEAVISFADLINQVEKHKENLQKRYSENCKCAILCESELHTAIAILSAWAANLVPIPLSIRYGERHCQDILNLTEPEALITDTSIMALKSYAPYNIAKAEFFDREMPRISCKDTELEDDALILCTSGTTGKPKGVVLSKKGLIFNIDAILEYFKISHNDTILIARPLYHCAVLTGEFLVSLMTGTNILFLDSDYSPMNLLAILKRNRITVLCGTPTLFHQTALLSLRQGCQFPVHTVAVSGECLSASTAREIRNLFPEAAVYSVYGLTECSPRVSFLSPDQFDTAPESVGIPIRGTEVLIVGEKEESLPPYSVGAVKIKSASVMRGYYKNPALTESVFRDGWLKTGDMGYKDEQGRLYILGRSDDMIIKGGMNLYPREIEEQIESLDFVKECAAYGFFEQGVCLIGLDLVLKDPTQEIPMKEIYKDLSEILPKYQLPARIQILSEILKTPSGKILRRKQS